MEKIKQGVLLPEMTQLCENKPIDQENTELPK